MSEPGLKPSRTWFIVVVSLGLAWILYLSVYGPAPGRDQPLDAPALKPPVPAMAVGPGWVVRDLQDEPVPFDRYRGRVVFLNLWATWCPPCLEELPAIANLAANPRLKDVAFLCISTDESAEAVRNYVKSKNWPMTVLRAVSPPPGLVADGLPATFVIAPDGRVVVAEVGSAQWDDPAVVDYLERLANDAGPGQVKPEARPDASEPHEAKP